MPQADTINPSTPGRLAHPAGFCACHVPGILESPCFPLRAAFQACGTPGNKPAFQDVQTQGLCGRERPGPLPRREQAQKAGQVGLSLHLPDAHIGGSKLSCARLFGEQRASRSEYPCPAEPADSRVEFSCFKLARPNSC